ncbi:MAG TPA: molecular chaperone TorD family protein [Pyrinomonadaceae bacterium]|jgi:TorA maturation chaperone TorD
MELFRALAVFAEPPAKETAELALALELGPLPDTSQYTELFVFQLYPYASVYLGEEGMLGGEARDRVAGFWRALGRTPPAEPDHLAVMLALYAQLVEQEEAASTAALKLGWRGARKAFLWEHLLSWLPLYLSKIEELAPPFYSKWAQLLLSALMEEAEITGKPARLPLALRESAGLADPRVDGVEEFLQSLLSSVRSGMILTRADLSRAAHRLGLGLRLGERKFILKALLGQDAAGMLGWLARAAAASAKAHGPYLTSLGEVAGAWKARALKTAALLTELELTAVEAAAGADPLSADLTRFAPRV